ncbi:MAG: hypothetical protein AB8H79_01845, partial [Myxococcota bacterium]
SAPDVPTLDLASIIPPDWERQDAIAHAVASAVETALPDLAWSAEPELSLRTRRVVIDRQALGYEGNDFPYPNGATFCGIGREADCDLSTTEDDLADQCVAFPDGYTAPKVAPITTGTLGGLVLVTFPGEPVTPLGMDVLDGVSALGHEQVFFVGYAQNYTGYALSEEDWWQGGYEANGTMWGPKQGTYLAEQVVESFRLQQDGGKRSDTEPGRTPAIVVEAYEPYVPETPTDPGTVAQVVDPSYTSGGVVSWTVQGLDPWLGTPVFTLRDSLGEPVMFGGRAVDGDSYAMGVSLAVQPTYRDEKRAEERTFLWTVEMPITRPIQGIAPDLRGSYTLSAEFADGTRVDSAVFEVADP